MNKLPNKNILWWATPHTIVKQVKDIFLTADTVVSYDSATGHWITNKINHWPGVPTGTQDCTIVCNNSNPYIRVYRAWRSDCIKRYKVLPTLEQWFTVQAGVRTSRNNNITDITIPISIEIQKVKQDTGKEPDLFIRTESFQADIEALSFIDSNHS